MLNREERRGLLWVTLFGVVLGAAVILLLFQAGTGPVEPKGNAPEGLPLASLAGRFVDAWSGEPLASPQVSIPALDGTSDYWLEEEDPLRKGCFRVGGLPAGGPYEVHLRVDGYEARRTPVTLEAGQALDLGDLTVRRLVSLSGWVVTGAGEPVPNAHVVAHDERGFEVTAGRSDPRGAWLLEALPEDAVFLSASIHLPERNTLPFAVDLTDSEQRHERILELPARRTVTGRLTEGGEPAQGVLHGGSQSLTLPPSGEFLLEDVPARSTWLSLQQEDGERTLLPPPVLWEQADTLPKRVRMECGGLEGPPARFPVLVAVRSRQAAEDGSLLWVSLASATLEAGEERTLSFRPGADQQVLWLGADGCSAEQAIPADGGRLLPDWRPPRSEQSRELARGFLVAAVDADHSALVQEGPRQVPDWDLSDPSWVTVARADRVPASLDWSPGPTEGTWTTLRGQVLDGQDAPVAWARVSLFAWADQQPTVVSRCLTDSSGTFHLRRPPWPGSESILVESHGQARVAQLGTGFPTDLLFHLPPPAVLLVRCEGPEDLLEQVRAVSAIVQDADSSLPWDSRLPHARGRVMARQQEDGSWRFPGLPPGACTVQVRLADGSTRSVADLVGEEPARASVHSLVLTERATEDGR